MNYRGSYRKLLGNAKAAMLGAIEIYNKPRFDYRDECFVILLLNAWELVLKAVVSKNKQSIYYPKRRKQPYRTLSLTDAFNKSEKFFPKKIDALPVRKNLELLTTYRDNAVHFYNEKDFGHIVYALAQTGIVNFKDLIHEVFGLDLTEEITWHLLPLGLNPPIDPIQYISGKSKKSDKKSRATAHFLSELRTAVQDVEDSQGDTGRLLTIFTVNLQSTKKIQKADIIVGVKREDEAGGPLVINRIMDPNRSHPLRQKDVLEKVGNINGKDLTSYVFQAIAWKHDLRSDDRFCWRASEGVLTRYSNDIIPWLKNLGANDVDGAVKDYRQYLNKKRKTKTP